MRWVPIAGLTRMGDRFVARPSPWRIVLLLAGAAGFVVLGAWIAGLFGPPPRPGREWIGWAALLFFGLCGAMGVFRLFDRDDQIVVDAGGLYWKQYGAATIPWQDIGRIEARAIKRWRFLCVFLNEPGKFPAAGWAGALQGANRGLGFGDLALSTAGTDRSHAELVAAIRRHAPAELLDI